MRATLVQIEQSSSRAHLRAAHEALDGLEAESAVELELGSPLHPRTPGQFSAWLQLVLTWGQNFHTRHLRLTDEALTRIRTGADLSDIEVVAVTLATVVRNPDGSDVTAEIAPLVRDVLEQRDVLTTHSGDGDEKSASLLLASQTFTNATSPELHAPWESRLAIEETARTLYHDVWAPTSAPRTLRTPLVEFGEEAVPEKSPNHITRTRVPDRHPSPPKDGLFVNLGRRAPQPRGFALDWATAVRAQAKPLHDEIGEILFELIQNTQWHATSWPGGRTGANCRAIHFREFGFTREQLREAETFDPHFVAYARAVANFAREHVARPIERARFGAVTIVDSGAGLARSVALSLGEEHLLTSQTEVNYLIKALSKSLKVRRADMGNIGLTRVQQSLTNLRGFMSIRTGTVEILRDFASRPFEPVAKFAGPPPAALFLDWVPENHDDFEVGPRIGTAVTVVYPVDFEGRG